jgi:hypothetical protein
MKKLYLLLLSAGVALACMATRVRAASTLLQPKVTWNCDTSTCFSLTIRGVGPVVGGDCESPSGDWDYEENVRVGNVDCGLELQPGECVIEWVPTQKVVTLPWYAGLCESEKGGVEADYNVEERDGPLRGWDIESSISCKAGEPCASKAWDWTITCDGWGPDLTRHCTAVPEPRALWLVGVGSLGLVFWRGRGRSRRTKD